MLWFLGMLGCGTPERAPSPPAAPAPAGAVELVAPAVLKERLFGAHDKVRLFNVWATWCAPCRDEMPRIRDWAADHPDVDVVLVNVDLVQARKAKVEPFIDEQKLQHLTHWQLNAQDPAYALSQVIPNFAFALPLTLVVDTDGKVLHRFDRVLTTADLQGLP